MKPFRVLSIDGGGIRGVIPATWLVHIQRKLGKPLYEYFDLIAGTSTGSILGAAVALGKDIEDCYRLYDQFGPTIFPRRFTEKNGWTFFGRATGPEYFEAPLADALQRLFAIDTALNDCKRRFIAVSYDVFQRNMFLMKSYDEATSQIAVWEACKASSSAPTYFPAHILCHDGARRPLIDGGVFANNPAVLAVSEAIQIVGKQSIRDLQSEYKIVMISLGTGSMQRPVSITNATAWGAINWIKPFLDVTFDSSSELSHFCAHHLLTKVNYVRLQVDLQGVNDDMDDASEDNINALKSVASSLFVTTDGQEKLERIISLLEDEN